MSLQYSEPLSKVSATASGAQTVSFAISEGAHVLHSAQVSTANGYAEPVRLQVVYKYGDGTTQAVNLKTGYVYNNLPLCLDSPRRVVGPADIRATVYQLEASQFRFAVHFERELI